MIKDFDFDDFEQEIEHALQSGITKDDLDDIEAALKKVQEKAAETKHGKLSRAAGRGAKAVHSAEELLLDIEEGLQLIHEASVKRKPANAPIPSPDNIFTVP